MGIMSSEWRGRLQHWMRTLKDDFYRPLGEISWEAFRTMDHLSQEEAMNGPFEPVEPGFTWGKTWEYCWFRGKVVLPAEAQGKRIVMDLKPDGESTLFVNGQEFGTYRASWVTQKHHFVEDNVLTTDAVAGTEYEILSDKLEDGQHEVILQRLEACPTNTLLRRLLDKTDIISYQKIIPGMNDIFIKLVKEGNITIND